MIQKGKKRRFKPRCECGDEKKSLQKCKLIVENDRAALFNNFWLKMTWDQRKVFVCNTVTLKESKNKTPDSRRKTTLKYTLKVNHQIIPVCKKMYLNTTGLGEWSVRNWVLKSTDGVVERQKSTVLSRRKRKNIHEESSEYLREFLRSFNKLPAHYCRKETSKECLEQNFQSMAQLHREYEKQCNINGKGCLSLTKLTAVVNELNIGIFTPRKDRCDECYKFENGNLEEELFMKHREEKDRARNEKEFDKNRAILGECHTLTMDLQAVKLCPQLNASSLYYKVKLCCHNFTIYDLATTLGTTCYWFDETKTEISIFNTENLSKKINSS